MEGILICPLPCRFVGRARPFGHAKQKTHLNFILSYFNVSIILWEIDGSCCGAVTIIFVRLRVLGNVLDAALGGHDDGLEDGGHKAPEADRGLVWDPLPPSWSGIRDTVLSVL